MQHFILVTLFDLTVTLISIRPMLISSLPYPHESLLAKFGLAAVIGPVSVADKVKSDDFDL